MYFSSYDILALEANHKMWYTTSSFVSFKRQSMIVYVKKSVLRIVGKVPESHSQQIFILPMHSLQSSTKLD